MEYHSLADELLDGMKSLHSVKTQKHINEAYRGEAFILDYLYHHDGEVVPSDLGCEMEVSSARVASALNNLEKKGLVTREIDINDRRRILLGITEAGRRLAQQHHDIIHAAIAEMLTYLGEHDAREYVRIQKRLAEILPNCNELAEVKDTPC
jgi:DNA-binding MarR family transcriptional regulator